VAPRLGSRWEHASLAEAAIGRVPAIAIESRQERRHVVASCSPTEARGVLGAQKDAAVSEHEGGEIVGLPAHGAAFDGASHARSMTAATALGQVRRAELAAESTRGGGPATTKNVREGKAARRTLPKGP
jgi:hypothetical protein